ncbi:MAG: hypothetical protein J2P40_14980 [Candidatus Dormibacteraeota bacterium]|nr:hypothetical protein [Candidatus Dormibacteraeota bacterium]MBO0762577.1 hypothetical protein [Candidatus Dormibacteraeota bacterium]
MTSGANRKPVRLVQSGLTGTVYAVTRYIDLGHGRFRAQAKHDVTPDFETLSGGMRTQLQRLCEIDYCPCCATKLLDAGLDVEVKGRGG